jgi:hypothetical protein
VFDKSIDKISYFMPSQFVGFSPDPAAAEMNRHTTKAACTGTFTLPWSHFAPGKASSGLIQVLVDAGYPIITTLARCTDSESVFAKGGAL